jgi:hypothetical protein
MIRRQNGRFRFLRVHDECMGTAIVVTLLVLLAVGLVTDQLLRLRRWLKKPPSSRPIDE